MGAVSAFTGRDYQPQPIQKREKEKRKRRREEKSETETNIVHLGFCEEKKKRKETPSVARLFLAHASCQRSQTTSDKASRDCHVEEVHRG